MASTTPYTSLITRATDSDDDPTLIYDITDRVKGEGAQGAADICTAVRRRFATYPSTDIKRRVLQVVGTLIIECGSTFHQAFIASGFLTTLAENRDQEITRLIPEHVRNWRQEMGPEYYPAFDQIFPPAQGSTGMTQQRPPGPVGQFKLRPVNPLVPFLTMPYIRAQRVLYLARDSRVFHMQSIHIARQALHLVILLNDLVDTEDGPDDEQEDERIDLEDELIELEDAMKVWGSETGSQEDYEARIPEIKKQYAQFFKQRFYFQNARDPSHDRIYKRLLAYDKKTIAFSKWKESHGTTSMGVYIPDEGSDEDDKSEAFIESVKTSPALSQANIPSDKTLDPKGKGKEVATGDTSLSRVNVALAPGEEPSAAGQEIEASGATSAGLGGSGGLDEIERARQFRSREAEDDRGEQNFRCPVPNCGRTFEKQYLLKHHIREHDDRPYRCPMRGCDRRFATPMEQRVHEALHRIKNMGVVPNMPDFAPPIASTSTVPAPAPVVPAVTEPVEPVKDKPDADAEDADDINSNTGDRPRPAEDAGEQWQEMPEGEALDEFLKPVIPGEGSSKPSEYTPASTETEKKDDAMEEDTDA